MRNMFYNRRFAPLGALAGARPSERSGVIESRKSCTSSAVAKRLNTRRRATGQNSYFVPGRLELAFCGCAEGGLFMQSELYKITNFVYFAGAACGLLFCKVRTAFIVPRLSLLRSGCPIGGACREAAT